MRRSLRVNPALRRLFAAMFAVSLLVAAGTVGFFRLGEGRWTVQDCAYMTVITISTVGYGELTDMAKVPGARALTAALIVSGIGTLAYFQGNLTALLLEGIIGQAFRRRLMQRTIASLQDHIVVAGAGSTGRHIIEELIASRAPFVVIDRDKAHLERISEDLANGKMLFVHGDATDDHALEQANIKSAKGIIAALTQDKDNLFVTLTARSLNPSARIVAKAVEDPAIPKLIRAGANSVVSPTQIGGRRMASELVRPQVNEFLDQMLRSKDKPLRIEEVTVEAGASFVGKALRDTPIRSETSLLVVAVRDLNRDFIYNPDPDLVLAAGTSLIVMGDQENVAKLRALAR
jgi:voltage-gated potassium channel